VETLLLHGLGELGIDTGKLSYGYGDGGKPYLKGEQGVYFNLSHSGEFALCAISPMEVGCDIEKIKKRSLAVAERFFCREEDERLEAQETPERKRDLFFRMWTAKESFMKATGCGMQMGRDSFSLLDAGTTGSLLWEQNRKRYYFRELEIAPGYKCTVCGLDRRIAAEPDMTLELLKFSELFDTEDSLHTEEG
jgi:4'-phosphopantetheinyl transferase